MQADGTHRDRAARDAGQRVRDHSAPCLGGRGGRGYRRGGRRAADAPAAWRCGRPPIVRRARCAADRVAHARCGDACDRERSVPGACDSTAADSGRRARGRAARLPDGRCVAGRVRARLPDHAGARRRDGSPQRLAGAGTTVAYRGTRSLGDDLERFLATRVCSGALGLAIAQHDIAADWIRAYKKYFDTDRPMPTRAVRNRPDDDHDPPRMVLTAFRRP